MTTLSKNQRRQKKLASRKESRLVVIGQWYRPLDQVLSDEAIKKAYKRFCGKPDELTRLHVDPSPLDRAEVYEVVKPFLPSSLYGQLAQMLTYGDYSGLHYGGPGSCFISCCRQVLCCGGEIVTGWIVHNMFAATKIETGTNSFGKLEAGCHAVWRSPDGILYELTDQQLHNSKFFVDDNVKLFGSTTLNFYDRVGTYRYQVNLDICKCREHVFRISV